MTIRASGLRRPISALLTVGLLLGGLLTECGATARADETTVSQETLRTGWDANEPGLAPSQVSSTDFGQQFATAVDGQVYAQPLVVGGTVVVGTENDNVYGIASGSGAVSWSRSLGAPWPASTIGCGDLVPNLGITATPVADPTTGTVYLTAKVNDGADANHPHWYLHALDAATGAEKPGWPVVIQGAPVNDPTHPFDPFSVNQRPGLLLMGGSVYAAFGSECDLGSYAGYLAGVNTSTGAVTLWTTENTSSSARAGIWMSGGGPVSDGPGRIIVSTGNGINPPAGPGTLPPGTLSESVVRLGVNSDGTLSAQDFFSPANAPTLDQNDTDFGSGGPVALPSPAFGTAAHPHLLVQVGKDGRIFLLDRDNLGGRSQGAGGTDAVLGTTGPFEGVWGHPGVFGGSTPFVYTLGSGGPLRALSYGTTGSGQPALTATAASSETFGYTSGSPVVTSTGSDPSTALVWVEYTDGGNGTNGQLRAYDAVPVNGSLHLRYSAPIGTTSKFAVPATDGGRVFVGTRDGRLLAFGRPDSAALSGQPVAFGNVMVGGTGSATATITAMRTVTVTGLSAAAPFAANPPSLPVTLTAGQSLAVPVTFSPTTPGPAVGQLTVSTAAGATGLALTGYGTQPGLQPSPGTLTFGTVPTGTTRTLGVTFTNTGTAPETVSATAAPAAPFSASGLPANGTVIQPQQSVAVQVTYTPTTAEDDTGSLSVTSTSGTATVQLNGTAVTGQAVLTLTPTATDFGQVRVGTTATASFDVSNTGNIPLTITKAAPPAAPFTTSNPLSEGQVLGPGQVIHQSVAVTPTATGALTGSYQISSDDGRGPQNETLTVTGTVPTGDVVLPTPGAGGWQLNGSAQLAGDDLILTQATAYQTGSAVFPTPVLTSGLSASFTAVMGGGTGADGETFALLDPTTATATSLGFGGGGLGWSGIPGVAVTLDTYKNANDPSNNFASIAIKGTKDALTYAQTNTNVPNLRSGPHQVSIAVTGTTVTVSLDGAQVLSSTVPSLPPAALVAFTGATGGLTDIHTVRGAAVSAAGYALAPPGPAAWTLNGSAKLNGTDLVLTPAVGNQAGSAFDRTPVSGARLHARFTSQIGGGTGADGTALVLLDAAKAGPTSLGFPGGGLGWSGLPGLAVFLDTWHNPGNPSNNFVAVAVKGVRDSITYAATSTAIPALRQGTHTVDVTATPAGHLQVAVDGTQVIDTPVTLPPNLLVGFSGGTGGATDVHTVRNVTISY
ncbi:choice-of-anchor D domain-containing protein [Kitasatospora viridis]|uniref:Putative pyrroloquinoline-quinone-binding quinoprotein n=1 Tax=Kitasatospora viridis TaxID=281105 RepID=A0A561S9I7_9ACTN|nr:choice-of-anchor D domain-containing protein [Kitasatospora viridis]TWF71524.1 putative pyrroloquinoline-quinone-binding quinoprotein [Kitasatospora viridis]